jgi:3-demethoxyubiquinol 3-hydroxylase
MVFSSHRYIVPKALMRSRSSDPVDRLIARFDKHLRAVFGPGQRGPAARQSPAAGLPSIELDTEARTLSGRLMRVNHTGEVCAQALYRGQAWTARTLERREILQAAAAEEVDHLTWCQDRLKELETHESYLNPAWFAGAFTLGASFGVCGDRWNMGFLAETERQVVAHLQSHLERLPIDDLASRTIVAEMCRDEAQHAATAVAHGAAELPAWVRWTMRMQAKIMTSVAAIW